LVKAHRPAVTAGWQRDLALSHGRVATVLARQGDRSGALRGFRQGRQIVARLRDQSPGNATLPKDLAWFDAQIGRLEAGNEEDAPTRESGSATAPNGRGWFSRLLGRG
jgi:hypothetical protein